MYSLRKSLRSLPRQASERCFIYGISPRSLTNLLCCQSNGFSASSPFCSEASPLFCFTPSALQQSCRQQSLCYQPSTYRSFPWSKQRRISITSVPTIVPSGAATFSSASSVEASSQRIKIYTRTGDSGQSSLYDGQRRRKDDPTFEALGDVDELNSALGLAHEYCSQAQLSSTVEQIEEIQSRLLDAGSAVATPLNSLSSKKVARVKFNSATVTVLEKWIDKMDEELPQLTSFILPSGGLPASSLHVARSICRRAERKVVVLVEEKVVDPSVVQYLNRLSDYLFTAARYTALKLGKPETIWRINKR